MKRTVHTLFNLAICLTLLIVTTSGCGRPPKTQVASSEVRFRNYANGVLTFDVAIRKGDSLCCQHGNDGSPVLNWMTPAEDKVGTLTVSASTGHLEISGCGNQYIATESVTLIQNPELKNGRYHVADYAPNMGAARAPTIPLYVYVKKAEAQQSGATEQGAGRPSAGTQSVRLKPDYVQAKLLARVFSDEATGRAPGVSDRLIQEGQSNLPGLIALVEIGYERLQESSGLRQCEQATVILGRIGDRRAIPCLLDRLWRTDKPEWRLKALKEARFPVAEGIRLGSLGRIRIVKKPSHIITKWREWFTGEKVADPIQQDQSNPEKLSPEGGQSTAPESARKRALEDETKRRLAAEQAELARGVAERDQRTAQEHARDRGLAVTKDLCTQLGAEDANIRKLAAKSLMDNWPATAEERAACEEAALSHLGKPSEDYAMRVLAACGGAKTVKALEPILDDPNARRAVYAAWVLAQLRDKAAAAKGIRRVAIFGKFHRNMGQQREGVDFHIAPDLFFHQTTGGAGFSPRNATGFRYVGGEQQRILDDLNLPFSLDDAEQQYAVRCYQLAEVAGNVSVLSMHFLRIQVPGMDKTYVPLLKEIAAHDSFPVPLTVNGRVVAQFQYRQQAAKAIAAITKEKATYLGLAGETLDSDASPQPYQDQDKLLARFFVDRVQQARLQDKSHFETEADREYCQSRSCEMMALRLREGFGAQVMDAIRQEARRREIDIKFMLPTEGLTEPDTQPKPEDPDPVRERALEEETKRLLAAEQAELARGVAERDQRTALEHARVDEMAAAKQKAEQAKAAIAPEFIAKIKAMLPDGWSVVAEKDVLTVRRDEKVEATYMSPVGMSPEKISTSDVIQIRVGPRISVEQYARMAEENRMVQEDFRVKNPNYPSIADHIDLPHVLPTHFEMRGQKLERPSLWISSELLRGHVEFKSKEVFDECSRVYAGVEGMFYHYSDTKGFVAKSPLLSGVIALRNAEKLAEAIRRRMPANWEVVKQRVVDWSAERGAANWPQGRGMEIVIQRQGFQPLDLKHGRGGQVVLAVLETGYTPPDPETAREAQAGNAAYLGPWLYPGVFGMVFGGTDWPTAKADIQAAMIASMPSQPPSAGSIRVAEVQGFATRLAGIMPANWEVASLEHRETGGPGWPKGDALVIGLQRKGITAAERERRRGGTLTLAVMLGPFTPPEPVGNAQVVAARPWGACEGHAVFAVFGNHQDWPNMEQDVRGLLGAPAPPAKGSGIDKPTAAKQPMLLMPRDGVPPSEKAITLQPAVFFDVKSGQGLDLDHAKAVDQGSPDVDAVLQGLQLLERGISAAIVKLPYEIESEHLTAAHVMAKAGRFDKNVTAWPLKNGKGLPVEIVFRTASGTVGAVAVVGYVQAKNGDALDYRVKCRLLSASDGASAPAAKNADAEAQAEMAFETFHVGMKSLWALNQTLNVKSDGAYTFEMQTREKVPAEKHLQPSKTPYVSNYLLSPGNLRELAQLLKATQWLAEPASPLPVAREDAMEYVMTISRDGKPVQRTYHDGDKVPAYVDLVRFLQRITRQEALLYAVTHRDQPAPGDNDLGNELDGVMGVGSKLKPYAPALDYHRLVPAYAEFLAKPGQSPRLAADAAKLMGYLKLESQRKTLEALALGRATDDPSYAVPGELRKAAVSALGMMGADQSLDTLETAGQAKDPWLQDAVADALLSAPSDKSIPILKELANRSQNAAWALIRVGRQSEADILDLLYQPGREEAGGRASYFLIRSYADHWKELPAPPSAAILTAVHDRVRSDSSLIHRYGLQVLMLADDPFVARNAWQDLDATLSLMGGKDQEVRKKLLLPLHFRNNRAPEAFLRDAQAGNLGIRRVMAEGTSSGWAHVAAPKGQTNYALYLSRTGVMWVIEAAQAVPSDGVQTHLDRFLRAHPQARDVKPDASLPEADLTARNDEAVGRVVERIMTAIRDKNVETLKTLAAGSVLGWLSPEEAKDFPSCLPAGWSAQVLEKVVKELYTAYAVNPNMMRDVQAMRMSGDWAAAHVTGPEGKLAGPRLIVVLQRTPQGWRLVDIDEAKAPLPEDLVGRAEHLAQLQAGLLVHRAVQAKEAAIAKQTGGTESSATPPAMNGLPPFLPNDLDLPGLPTAGKPAEKKLKVILPSGAEIELVAVSDYPDKNAPWWRPDGTRLDVPPIDRADGDITSDIAPKLRKVELVFRLGGKAAQPAYESQIRGSDSDGHGVWWAGRRSRDGKFAEDLKVVGTMVPLDAKTMGLDLMVAAGPWETVAESDGRQAAGLLDVATPGDPAGGSGPSTAIAARFDPDKLDAQVIGLDVDGGKHVVRGFDIRRGANDAGANFRFQGLAPAQLKSFTLQTRPNNELIRLTDVSLLPGQGTDARLAAIPSATQPGVSASGKQLTQLGQGIVAERLRQKVQAYQRNSSAEREIMPDPDNPDRVLENTASSENVRRRRLATAKLVDWADQEKTRARLAELAQDKDVFVKLHATGALASRGRNGNVEFLLRLASGAEVLSSSEFERDDAAWMLLALGERLPAAANNHSKFFDPTLEVIRTLQQAGQEIGPEVLSQLAKKGQPAEKWGEAVDGVQVRLRADKAVWKAGEVPDFKADVRNNGKKDRSVAQAQELCELELDGTAYRWVGGVRVRSSAFPPGREYKDIPISFDPFWHSKKGDLPLNLAPGKHTLRVWFSCRTVAGDAKEKDPLVVSNPVKIEILPADAKPAIPPGALSFGPVIEQMIPRPANGTLENCWAFHLASGKVVTSTPAKPLDFRIDATDTLRAAGVDLYQHPFVNSPDAVNALDLRLVSRDADAWNLPAVEAMALLEKNAVMSVGRSVAMISGSHVYVFSSRDGTRGVLQTSGADSPTAKIRYKLVQPAAGESATPPLEAARLSAEEQPLAGIWRLSQKVYSDDNQEETELMVLATDRTWLHVTYPRKEEIPTRFRNIARGPRWMCYEGRLRQYHPAPEGGGEHLYDRKILSFTPTTLSLEYERKPDLGPVEYTRVSEQAEVEIKKVLSKSEGNENWGAAVDGVQVRLRADKTIWKTSEVPAFKADVRNNGKTDRSVAQAQQLCELELDGTTYRWVGDVSVKSSAFPPGREYKDIPISLDPFWHTRKGDLPLNLAPGKHTLRVWFSCPAVAGDARAKDLFTVIVSNPAEFEILPADAKPATQAAESGWGEIGTGGLQMRLVILEQKDRKPPLYPEAWLEARNTSDLRIDLALKNRTQQKITPVHWKAGMHVDVQLPDGTIRPYYCIEPGDQTYWQDVRKPDIIDPIEPGRTARFVVNMRQLVAKNGARLIEVQGACQLRPVLEVTPGEGAYWSGLARGGWVSVHIAKNPDAASEAVAVIFTAGGDPASAAQPAEKDSSAKDIEQESMEQAVHNLAHSSILVAVSPSIYDDYLIDCVSQRPQVAKLLKSARDGTADERGALRTAILRECAAFLKDLPDFAEEGKPWKPSAMSPGGAMAYPLILRECDSDAESLPVLVQMWLRHQEALRKHFERQDFKPPTPKWIGSDDDGAIQAYACKYFLDQYVAREDLRRDIKPGQAKVLEAYKAYHDALPKTDKVQIDQTRIMRLAVDFVAAQPATSDARPLPPAGEVPWGEVVDGVQIRLRADKVQWQAGQLPKMSLAVRNRGETSWSTVALRHAMGSCCWLEWDGQWYERSDTPRAYGGNIPELPRGGQLDVDVPLDNWALVNGAQRLPLVLTPGRHIARMRVQLDDHHDSSQHARLLSNPVEVEITPGSGAEQEKAAWVALLVKSPIRSLNEYSHTYRTYPSPAPPLYMAVPLPDCELEMRRAGDQTRVARIRNTAELNESDRRKVGQLQDGQYLVALCVGDTRISNVAAFELDSRYDPTKEKTLRLVAIEGNPQGESCFVGMRGTGPTPKDDAFGTWNVHLPTLVVDHTERNVDSSAGSFFPMAPGVQFESIVDVRQYKPPVALDQPHTIKAKVRGYESQPVAFPAKDTLGRTWDKATAKIGALPPAPVLLSGLVVGIDGKEGRNYEVTLVSEDGAAKCREKADESGHYSFTRIPPGTYKLGCNPPSMGQPGLAISGIVIRAGKTMQKDVSLEGKFILAGRVTDADGKPIPKMTVDLSCEDRQAGAEFMDTTQTDEQGRYRLASPLGTVTYIGVNGKRINGNLPRPIAGENPVGFPADKGHFRANLAKAKQTSSTNKRNNKP